MSPEQRRPATDPGAGFPAGNAENLAAIFEALSDLVLVAALDGRLLYANRALSATLGYSPEELAGMHALDLHPPALRAQAEAVFADLIRGARDSCPVPLQRKSGPRVPVAARSWVGTWNGEGCLLYVARDLTREQQERDKFALLFEGDPTAMTVSYGDSGRFTDVNAAFLASTGYTRDEVIGRTAVEIGWPVDADAWRRAGAELREHGRLDGFELQVRAKDGSVRDGLLYGSVVESEGEPQVLTVMLDVTERNRIRDELRVANTRLEATLEALPDLLFRVDCDGRIREGHAAQDERYYVPPSVFLGKRFADVLPAEANDVIMSALAEAAAHGVSRGATYPLTMPQGVCWFELSIAAMGDAHQPDAEFIVLARDVTERHTAEQLLRASMDGMLEPQALLTAVRDGTGTIVDFTYQHANRAACEYLSRSREELIGASLLQASPDIKRESEVFALYAGVVESGEPLASDDFVWTSDETGETHVYDIRATRVGDGLSLTWRNVTERYESARRLAESEARYRLLVENAADVVFRSSLQGRLTWLSPAVSNLLGWQPDDLVGHTFREIVHPDDQTAVETANAGLQTGTGSNVEARFRRRTGSYRWLAVAMRPILDEAGLVVAASGGWRDIQAEVEAREALQRSEAVLRGTLDGLLEPHVLLTAVRDETGAIVDFVYADANPAACEYNKMTREELVGARLLALLPGHARGLLQTYAHVVETGEPLVEDDVAYEQELRGSREQRYDLRGTKIGDGLSLMWRDVTARHKAEAAIRQRVAELAALNKLAQLLVQRVDLEHALRSADSLLTTLLAAQSADVRLITDERQETAAPDNAAAAEAAAIAAALAEGDAITAVAADGVQLLVVPLIARSETLGALLIRRAAEGAPYDAGEQAVAQTAADLLAGVVRLERLHVQEKEAAAGEERRRIARDLHDAVTQSIHSAGMLAEALPTVWEQDPDQGREDLLMIRSLIGAAFSELRILLYELRPETLAAAPLETLFERLRDALAGRGESEVALAVEPALELPEEVRTAFYRVAQEALNNVGKYAHAEHVAISVHRDDGSVHLTVRDDGRGFEPAAARAGMGLGIMRERAAAIGAALDVASAAGAGTTISLAWRPGGQTVGGQAGGEDGGPSGR